ncbi:YkgJ family cysteine cluster protein [Candidatus Micrarchaeota archaeon]|nr:YkgJ family cysteine cluster protein [Candidatus Micrarchaeota archaeon]
MVGLFGPCSHCNAKCCKHYAVHLTAVDIARLHARVKGFEWIRALKEGSVKKPPAQAFFIFENGRIDEYYLFLERNEKEECVFLGKQNECLVYNARPRVCRVYPFIENEQGKLECKQGCRCPEWKLSEKEEKEFHENIEKHQQELDEHGKMCREWNATKAKKGSVKKFVEFLLKRTKYKILSCV